MNAQDAAGIEKHIFSSWVKDTTEAELQQAFEYLSPLSSATNWRFMETETAACSHRALKTPHWTIVPTFILSVISAITCAVAACVSWIDVEKWF